MAARLNASTIKAWFQYRCERKVRYETAPLDELESVPVTRDIKEHTWAAYGIDFERRVMDRLALQEQLLRPLADDKGGLSERLALAFLRGARNERYAAQVNLKPRALPAMLSGQDIELTRTYPDLIRRDVVEGVPTFTVADVKATRRAATFHKAQVAYYVRILETFLREAGVEAHMAQTGEIWRIPDVGDAASGEWQVETFALAPYLRLVEEFCTKILPTILSKALGREVDETFFHVYFKCEQCDFLEHCFEQVSPSRPPQRRDVSAAPGLTHEAKRSLQRMGIHTVADLAQAQGLARTQGLSWSLSRRAEILVSRAKALRDGRLLRTGEEHTYLMPPRADERFFLSVDHDPIDDRIAALGYRRVRSGQVVDERVEIVSSGDAVHEIEAIVSVLGALIADLGEIDQANRALGPGAGAYAHIFFYEPTEAVNLQRALGRHLEDERIRNGLLDLIRLFPPEDIVPEPEFRGVHHLPATAVRSVLEQLYALPVSVSYDLRQTSAAIAAHRGLSAPPYAPDDTFARPFSSLLAIDVIRSLKEEKGGVTRADVISDVGARLGTLQGVVEYLYQEHDRLAAESRPLLRLAKRPFQFQASFDPLNALDLDVLTACELLENRAGLLDTLIRLAEPARRRTESGRCMSRLSLRNIHRNGGRCLLVFDVPEESQASDLGPGDFGLIVTDDEPDLRLDPTRWPLVSCRIAPPGAGYEDRVRSVSLAMAAATVDGPVMQSLLRRTRGPAWFVDRSFADVNTGRAVAFLNDIGRGVAA